MTDQNEIDALVLWYADNMDKVPDSPVILNAYSTITNPQRFVESHLRTVKNWRGLSISEPFVARLQEFKAWINENEK